MLGRKERDMFHIIDIDNTLIYTDVLNTKGYLHGLASKGLEPLETVQRITRDSIHAWYPELSVTDLGEIVAAKQKYVQDHMQLSRLNDAIAEVLAEQGASKCALWTAAHPKRIHALLDFHGVTGYTQIRYSSKSADDVKQAIQYFCHIFSCQPCELCFYEDNHDVIRELQRHHVTVKKVRMC